MYTHLLIACLISLVGVNSIPVPNNELDIVQVPLSNGKVSLTFSIYTKLLKILTKSKLIQMQKCI